MSDIHVYPVDHSLVCIFDARLGASTATRGHYFTIPEAQQLVHQIEETILAIRKDGTR